MHLLPRLIARFSQQHLLKNFGIINGKIVRNLRFVFFLFSVPEYYESGINFTPADPQTKKNQISNTGAFCAYSGSKTG
jgi:hypothetical protein